MYPYVDYTLGRQCVLWILLDFIRHYIVPG